jgi:hypothetical protein
LQSCKCTAAKYAFSHSYWESFCLRDLSMIRAVRQRTDAAFINSESAVIESNVET